MKLLLVAPSQGFVWLKLGVQTFFRQPLALIGQLVLFMMLLSVLSMVPVLGTLLGLALIPSLTLGLMVAAQQAAQGRFPMPKLLLTGLLGGWAGARNMLVLGLLYMLGFMAALGLSASMDGGDFARLYLLGGELTEQTVQQNNFQSAALLALALLVPLSLLFWHAPALVYWHGVAPLKSLFFSAVACLRNFWAFAVFSLAWAALFLAVAMGVRLLAGLLGNPGLLQVLLLPLGLALTSMLLSSLFFTFRDCFDPPPRESP